MLSLRIAPALLIASALLVGTTSATPEESSTATPGAATSWTIEDARPGLTAVTRNLQRTAFPLNTAEGVEWKIDDTVIVDVTPSVETIFKEGLDEYIPDLTKAQRQELQELQEEKREKERRAEERKKERAEKKRIAAEKAEQEEAAEKQAAENKKQAKKSAKPQGKAIPAGQTQKIAHEMVMKRGWDEGQFSCLVKLWNKESNWNHRAENPSSGAYGIPQSLPGNKMASAGSDWRSNPATQIKWGLGYIKDRYGSPCAAWAHSGQVGWY